MSDRSDELRRQRDLIKGHLAWMEGEIRREDSLQGGAPAASPAVPPAPAATPRYRPPSPVDDRDAESILAEYRQPTMSVGKRAKLGCILYFIVAMVLLGAALSALYFFAKARHGH